VSELVTQISEAYKFGKLFNAEYRKQAEKKIFKQSKIVKMWCLNILWELEEMNLMRHKKKLNPTSQQIWIDIFRPLPSHWLYVVSIGPDSAVLHWQQEIRFKINIHVHVFCELLKRLSKYLGSLFHQ
jgi:hypothetical protein